MILDLPRPLQFATRAPGDRRRDRRGSGDGVAPGSSGFGDRRDGELDAWRGLHCDVLSCSGLHQRRDLRLAESVLLLHQAGGCACVVAVGRGEQRYTARSGAFDFFPAGIYRHVLIGPLPARAIAVHIPAGFEYAVQDERGGSGTLPVQCQFGDRRLATMVEDLARAGARDPRGPDAVVRSVGIVDRLFDLLDPRSAADASGFSTVLVRLVAEYVDDRIQAGLKPDDLAVLTGLGRARFARAFKRAFGLPLHGYVLARRVHLAKQRLRGSARVTQIAHDLGFASHAHFTTTFCRLAGMTPSAYRDGLRASVPETPDE